MVEKREFEIAGLQEGAAEKLRKNNKRKHTRRAALKYAAKIAAGATLWGAGGYLGGKVFNYTVKPVVDGIIGTSERIKGAYEGLQRLNPFRRRIPMPMPQEPVSRRGFLSSLARMAYHHPVAAGTSVGATYGAGKYALSGMSKYLTDRQIATLKDTNADYHERLEILEQYRVRAEADIENYKGQLKDKDARLEKLERSFAELRRQIKPGKLELAAEESGTQEPTGKQKEALLAIGISGLLISIGLSSSAVTGNAVSGLENSSQMFPLIIALFISSLTFILSGIERRKIKAGRRLA